MCACVRASVHVHVCVCVCLFIHAQNHLRDAEVIKLYSCSNQLSMRFFMLIKAKMPTIVGILTFISRINTTS